MDNIREQIQETGSVSNALGEFPGIGDIVSLINDIADQTNILSLTLRFRHPWPVMQVEALRWLRRSTASG